MLHGQGSTGKEFIRRFIRTPLSKKGPRGNCIRSELPSTRWVIPEASFQTGAATPECGRAMGKEWFLHDPSNDYSETSQRQMVESMDTIMSLIKREETFVPRRKIFLGGFDQGLSLAIAILLVDGKGDFAGVFGFGGWMFNEPLIAEEATKSARNAAAAAGPDEPLETMQYHLLQAAREVYLPPAYRSSTKHFRGTMPGNDDSTPVLDAAVSFPQRRDRGESLCDVLILHAYDDDKVPVECGRQMYRMLREMGLNVSFRENATGLTHPRHWISSRRGMDDVCNFIRGCLGNIAIPKMEVGEPECVDKGNNDEAGTTMS